MTCNSAEQLSLTPCISPVQLTLQRPSTRSVLEHLVLVAVCEGLHTDVASLLHLAELCQNDVRWLHNSMTHFALILHCGLVVV